VTADGSDLKGVVSGFDHVGIQVQDIDRSVEFYERHLGFRVVDRVTKREPYVQRVVGYYPNVTLEIAVLQIPGSDVFLEILEYRGIERSPIDPATGNPGTAHFCVFVDDLEELYCRLKRAGVEFVSELQTPTAGPNEGGRLVYMIDPDGIRVELVQTRLRSDGTPR
jgi:lactoylglutathione lyase